MDYYTSSRVVYSLDQYMSVSSSPPVQKILIFACFLPTLIAKISKKTKTSKFKLFLYRF